MRNNDVKNKIDVDKNCPPNGWQYKALTEVCDIVSGGTPNRGCSEYWEGGTIPWATPTDITSNSQRVIRKTKEYITEKGLKNSSAKLVPQGSLLMTSRATIGEIKVNEVEMCTNQGFKILVPNEFVDNWFLFYQMKFLKQKYEALGSGSTFLEVSKRDTERFSIPMPIEIAEQKKIGNILITLDNVIEKTKQLIDKYKKVKQGLMQDLFTRGVLPDGKLRPKYEEAPELYNETAYGFVPKGWKVGVFSDLAEINPPKVTLRLPDQDLVSFIAMEDLSEEGKVINKSTRQLKQVKSGYTQFMENDIIFAKITPCMENGKGGIATKLKNGIGYGSTEFYIIRAKDMKSLYFLYQYTLYKPLRVKAEMQMTGSAGQQRVSKDFFERYQILIPPIEEQVIISNILNECDMKIEKEQEYYDKLCLIKQALMQDLLTGKVRVKIEGDRDE